MFTKAPMDGYASVILDHEAEHVTKIVDDKNKHLENPVFKRFVLYQKTALPRKTLPCEVFIWKILKRLTKDCLRRYLSKVKMI